MAKPTSKAPTAPPKAAKPTASASPKKPSVPKSAVKNGPASKPKPKPATSGAKPPVKQAVPTPAVSQPPTATTTTTTNKMKPRVKASKDKKDTSAPTRPTLSDGKTEREIWHPSDGNGDPSPDLVEKFRSKKGGHPTWKLYTGRNVPKQPTDSNPPRFAYLDDKAAWDILHSKTWTANEKHRYWPMDFTPQGRISFLRAHRGRPAYERDGRTFASIRKQKDKRYWMHGCHPAPAEGSSIPSSAPANDSVVAEGSTAAAPTEQAAIQANDGTKNQVPEKAPVEEQTPLAEKVSPSEQTSEPRSVPEPQPVPEPQLVLELQTPPPSAPTEPLNNTAPPSPTSSVQSTKRPASPDNLANPAPKRQRMGITPYTIPAEVQARDSELAKLRKELREIRDRDTNREDEMHGLRERAAFYQRAAIEMNAALEGAKKKGEAFRKLALRLYARTVDQEVGIANHHKSMLRIEKSASDLAAAAGIFAADARTAIELTTKTHSDLDEILDGSEQAMREAGLQEEFNDFVEEAMALE